MTPGFVISILFNANALFLKTLELDPEKETTLVSRQQKEKRAISNNTTNSMRTRHV